MTARLIPLQLVTQICERTTRPNSSALIQVACSSCRPPIALPTPWSPHSSRTRSRWCQPRSKTLCKWTKSRRVVQQLVASSRVRCTKTWPPCSTSTFNPYRTRSASSCKCHRVCSHSSSKLHRILLALFSFILSNPSPSGLKTGWNWDYWYCEKGTKISFIQYLIMIISGISRPILLGLIPASV